ncbi:MAG: hypothetical protein IT244_10215 [Bacteroidia bacterium]|nr:hypothetical protein [Bacteroidia bacterium]
MLCFFTFFAKAQNFFSNTTYIGAFGTEDWTANWSNWNPRTTSYPSGSTLLQGAITSNTTLSASKTYLLKGYVYVKNNATLTIEPGTIIRCDVLTASALIITRGAKIICNGTESQPIIFTSSEASGSRAYGDWGGIVMLGNAKINAQTGTSDIGAGINNANGDGVFGGNDDDDSSGSITYTRIEFAGVQYQPDKEISGLMLGGVGRKTTLHHIQLSFCGNDGIHIAGGTARLRHLIMHRGYNSDLTIDMGYRGLIQFAVVLRDSTKASPKGSSGIEIQNDALATNATPFTDPTLSNLTVLGPLTLSSTTYNSNYRYAIHFKRNGRGAIFNSAFAGYPKGLVLDGPGVASSLNTGAILFENNVLAGNKTTNIDTLNRFAQTWPNFDKNNWLLDASRSNNTFTSPRDLKLQNPYAYNSPVFLPVSGSPLLTGASFSNSRLAVSRKNIFNSGLQLAQTKEGWMLKNPKNLAIKNAQMFDLSGRLLAEYLLSENQGESFIPASKSALGILVVYDVLGNILLKQQVLFL